MDTATEASVPDQSTYSEGLPADSPAVDQQRPTSLSNANSSLGLDALLLQHREIGDWSAIVDKQIIENPLPMENDHEDAKKVVPAKKISTTAHSTGISKPPAELRSPFYAYAYGINFVARKVDIFYFFGGPKNVADLHLYTNNAQQQPRFNGDCLILATSFEALVEVLRKDGEELMGREIKVDYVNPTNQDRKRFSEQQLDNARLVSAPVISYNQNSRGGGTGNNNYHRQDSSRNADQYSGSGGNQNQNRSSYSPRGVGQHQNTSPSGQPSFQEQQRRSKFMPNSKASNDVRASMQGGVAPPYNQNQQRPPPAAAPPQYERQSSYQQRSNAPAWSSSTEKNSSQQHQQPEERHPPVVVKKTDIFGAAKPVDTAKREQEIADKLAEERKLAKEAQLQQQKQQNSANAPTTANQHQQPQQFYNTNAQPHRHSIGHSNSSSQQSLHQLQVRILKHSNPPVAQQQRKQSISEAHPVPLNQCHPPSRDSLEATTPNLEGSGPDTNRWSPELPQEEESPAATVVRQGNAPSGRGGFGRGTRSGSESSSNFVHQQRPRNNLRNRQQHKDGHGNGNRGEHYNNREGGRFGRPAQQQQHAQHQDHRRAEGEGMGDQSDRNRQNFNNHHHRSNNSVRGDTEGAAAHNRQQQGGAKQKSPPRLGRNQIDRLNRLVQPGQGIKGESKTTSNQPQQPQHPDNNNQQQHKGPGGHGHMNKRTTYVNSKRGDNREGGPPPPLRQPQGHARMTKKQSMDSKMDDSAREELQHNKHHPKAGQLRQGRSDSTPNVVTGSKASVISEGGAPAVSSKNMAVPPSPTTTAAVPGVGVSEGPGAESSKQSGSAVKKNNKKKSNKKDAAGSSTVATNNKFSALADSSM